MKRVLGLLLALCALCLCGCGDETADAAEVVASAERALNVLEEAGYKVTFVTDADYLLQMSANMNASGNVKVEHPLVAYLEGTNAITAGDDAIEIYAFTSRKDADCVAEYLVTEYLEQKYQVYQTGCLVCIGTLEAIQVLK